MSWVGAGKLALVGLVAAVVTAPAPHTGGQPAAKPVTAMHAVAAKYGSASGD